MGGDNLVQNYPLRVLSGELIIHGHLPLWNPDIWSGAPLLAGWNAGAMFPGTWLFAVLPGVAAWELNVIAVSVIAGIGLHVFLRRQGCSPVASFLGALTFSYTGFMSAQSVHLGLVMGMAFAPWILVALDEMERAADGRALLRPAALLAIFGALVVLAGDPRAISNVAVIAVVYLFVLFWRSFRRVGRPKVNMWWILGWTVAGGLFAIALSAVQWLPGLEFLHQSQRSSGNLSYFGLYSLSGRQLAYLFSPFIFGGNGTLGLPTTNFNLPEYTYSVGILPLVALFAFAPRTIVEFFARAFGGLPRRGRESTTRPIGVYFALVIIGIVLALGKTTPLGHLLVHVPLYGGQRLQIRNMGITDLALSALVAFFIDYLAKPSDAGRDLLDRGTEYRSSAPGWPERICGAIPSFVIVSLVIAMVAATAGTERFLGAKHLLLGLPVRMAPYYAFEVVVALVALVIAVSTSGRHRLVRHRLAIAVVGADVVMFIAMASYQPAPTPALAAKNLAVKTLIHASGNTTGRQAIFNPQQLPVAGSPNVLDNLGVDDLVVIHHLSSVQGYGSAVSAAYEQATGTHEVENLRTSAFLTPTFDSLNLRVLATLPELFGTPRRAPTELAFPTGPPLRVGSSPADRQPASSVDLAQLPPAGPWSLDARRQISFELPGPLAIDRVTVRLAPEPAASSGSSRDVEVVATLLSGARRTALIGVSKGIGTLRVSTSWAVAGGGVTDIGVSSAKPADNGVILEAVAVHVGEWRSNVPLTSNASPPSKAWFQLDGMLQGLLEPSTWRYEGRIGAVLFYRNLKADGQVWLQPASSQDSVTTQRAIGTVSETHRAEWQDPVDVAFVPNGALLVRSAAYASGWSATAIAARKSGASAEPGATSVALPVKRVGLLEGVRLPPGRWIVTWHYRSSRAAVGLDAGALALLVLMALYAAGGAGKRASRRDPER